MVKNISTNRKRPLEERVEEHKLFYKRLNKRPLFGFFVGSEFPLKRYNAASLLPEGRPLMPDDFNVEAYVKDSERLFKLHEECGGDFIWSASAFWGIPWLEVIAGCDIYADHATGSIRSEPPHSFKGAASIEEFNENSPWVLKAKEFIKALADLSQGKFPIGTTRMRGISDLLSALYGGENFVYAMMEEPEEVENICKKLTEIWIGFGKIQLDLIPLFFGGVGSFYYNMWAPVGTVWLQEDAAALLSPSLFKRCILPYDINIIDAFKGCIIHMHPSNYVPVDEFVETNILALELHIDEGGPTAEELFYTHRKILEKKPLVIWGNIPESDLEWIFNKLPPQGLAVNTVVPGLSRAEELWNKYLAGRYF